MLKLLISTLLCTSTVVYGQFGVFTFKCSTAMVCTDLPLCDQYGVMQKSAVTLTPEEEEFRQPLLPCLKTDKSRGVCCRDPEYKDDWPTDMDPAVPCLPPNRRLDNGKCGLPPTPPPNKVSEDTCKPPAVKLPNGKCGVPTKKTPPPEKKTPPPKVVTTTPKPKIVTQTVPTTRPTQTTTRRTTTVPPPSFEILPPQISESPGCPRRNRTAMPDKVFKPYDSSDFEAGAGEFPWQGAVFTSSGQFLCVCYSTYNSTCTTTASCVKDYNPSELMVAVGIYDISLKDVFEPVVNKKKTPQVSGVKAIAFDPKYESATGKYDIALLHMKNQVVYNYYTKAICLDEYYAIDFFSYDDCVVTGWGGSDTYHYIDVELLSEAECKRAVPGFDARAMSCAKPNHDVCKLVEFGGGFHCRETGKRNKKSSDVYLLKGTYSAVNNCSPGSQVITFSKIIFEDWFIEALYNPFKYPLRG